MLGIVNKKSVESSHRLWKSRDEVDNKEGNVTVKLHMNINNLLSTTFKLILKQKKGTYDNDQSPCSFSHL